MTGRVIIVTGANTGIGFAAAQNLCEGGNDVILACRSEEKGKAAVEQILKKNPNALATFMQLDLADMASIRKFVEDFHATEKKLNVLINNAGVTLPTKQWTKDNFDMVMGTNHLGHFLLTHLLLEDLKKTASEAGEARIVNVTSTLHDKDVKIFGKGAAPLSLEDFFLSAPGAYSDRQSYKNSKLCNVLMTLSLSKQLEGTGVTCNCVCPGFVRDSQLSRHFSPAKKFFYKVVAGVIFKMRRSVVMHTLEEGGRCLVDLAVSEEQKGVTGKFFSNFQEKQASAEALDEELQKNVYELSARYCHLEGFEPLDAPAPPPPEEKRKSKKSKKTKSADETQIEDKGEEKKEGEEDAQNTTDDIKYADADTSKVEVKAEEDAKADVKEEDVEEKGDGDKPKELEPEEKEIKKTEDAVIIETQAEVTAQ